MKIFIKNYKYIITLLLIFIFEINNSVSSQSMDESRRAIQHGNDISRVNAENKMCQNYCSSNFRNDVLNNPSSANRILDRCLSNCRENYQSKISCIQSQLPSKYLSSNCNSSFSGGSQNTNESNSSNGALNFVWMLVFCIVGLFFFKRKDPERFNLIYLSILNYKDKFSYKFQKNENSESFSPQLSTKNIIFWMIALSACVISYFRENRVSEHNSDAFWILPAIIFSGIILTTGFQSLFLRDKPIFKIPDPITYSLTSFIIGLNSYLFSMLIMFIWEAIVGIGNIGNASFNPLFFGMIIFIFNTIQIKCFAILIKPSPNKYLYIGISAILIMIYSKFSIENKLFAMTSILAYIFSIALSKINLIEKPYIFIISISGFEGFVKILLKFFKYESNNKVYDRAVNLDEKILNHKKVNKDRQKENLNLLSKISSIFYLLFKKLFLILKNLAKFILNFFKVRKFLLIITFFIPISATLIYYELNNPTKFDEVQSVKFLISPDFEYVFAFSNGRALVKNENSQYFINTQGLKVFDNPSNASEGIFSEGLLAVAFKDGFSNDWGFVDTNGKTVISPRFSLAKNFSEGLAAVVLTDGDKWGFIDKKGSLIIKPSFETPSSFNNGIADVVLNEAGVNKKGFIDTSGNFLIAAQYSQAYAFDGDLAPMLNSATNKWGFIDKQGKIIIENKFDSVTPFSEGLAAVEVNEKWGFIDNKGEFVIKPIFLYINFDSPTQEYYHFNEGLAAVWIGDIDKGKMGFINRQGAIVIKPNFEEVKNFSDGLAAVRVGDQAFGKWGFINKKGEFIIKPIFDQAHSFREGFASVSIGGEYTSNGKFEAATVIKGSKWGVIYHPINKSN